MTTTPTSPLPSHPGQPHDPAPRDRYSADAEQQRERNRAAAAQQAAETPPSRTPAGPIRVIAALVALVLVVLAGASLIGPMLKQSETTEQALPAVTAVQVDGEVGEIRIRAAEPGESAKAVTTSTWGLWRPSNSVTTSNGVSQLRSTCPTQAFGTVCSTDWLVVVPAGTDLTLTHGVGSVNVEGLAGDIDVHNGVGDISITEAAGGAVSVDNGVGSVSYEAVEPPRRVDLGLGVGEATVRVPDSVDYRVSTSGSAEIRNTIGDDDAAERAIRIEVGVGSISLDPS